MTDGRWGGLNLRLGPVTALALLALAAGALLVACDGGGRRILAPPAGCADGDADADGVCNGVDACPGTPAGCVVGATGCIVDSDGDGVCDGVDACPGTAAGCVVDATGCPTADADGDGVCDGNDACGGTPAGCTVDATGCTVDTDADGVCDGNDACPADPGTPGCPVGPNGCPPAQCGQCDAGLLGDTADGNTTSCWHVTSLPIGQGGCNEEAGPIDIEVLVDLSSGSALLTVNTCQNASCQGGQDAPLLTPVTCDMADPCTGDPTIATCDVVDANGAPRQVLLHLQEGGDVVLCITNLCGEQICKTASQDADADCDVP